MAMETAAAQPLDGAIVRFLVRVLERFEVTVADPGTLNAALHGVGLDDDGIAQYRAFFEARASDVATLTADLPALLAELQSSDPDLVALVAPAKRLWGVVTGLVTAAPTVADLRLPHAPGRPNGDVVGQLLTAALERALRDTSPALWAALTATGFVGPGTSVLAALDQVADGLAPTVWRHLQTLRREHTLAILGVLTGPRVLSLSSAPLGAKASDNPDVVAAFGADAVVMQRLVLQVAADTYGDPIPLTIEILGTETLPPTFVAAVLSLPTIAAPLDLGPSLRLSLDPLNAPFALALTGAGTVRQVGGAPPKLTLAAALPAEYVVGSDDGIRLRLQQPVVELAASPDAWGATLGITTFELGIPKAAAGALIGLFLPAGGITLRGKLLLRADEAGLHFDGGVGLSATWPDVIHLPGVTIHSLTTSVAASGTELPLTATGTIVAALGPLTVTIEGFGIRQALRLTTDGSGNLGLIDVPAPRFALPTGIGVAIDAKLIKGGGFLRVLDTEISGALELSLALGTLELAIQAFGVVQELNGEVSCLIVMSVQFAPPIEIFLGLTLNAVGGLFGFNRTLDTPALRGVVAEGRTKDVLIPDDLIARADQVLKTVAAVFPPKPRHHLAAPILQLGWGRPTPIVTMTAGVVFTFPNPAALAIIGELRIAAPNPDEAIIDLRASFAGVIDLSTGDVAFDASLTRSRIGTFDLAGDLALRAGGQAFVFTAGGFHPQFAPPPDLARMRRLSLAIAPSSRLNIHAESYFAVTASSLQFGAAMYVEAKLGPITGRGHVSLDTLIQTEPRLHFVATICGELALIVAGEELATATVDILLEGPGRWHARARASISVLFFSISGTLDLEWGTEAPLPLGPPVDVAQEVLDALSTDAAWRHVLPAADAGVVQLRSGATALHPLGLLRLTQTAAPLGIALTKYGASALASPDPVTVAITAAGAVVAPAQDLFASAQFFELSDEDRISKPAFVAFDAGCTVQGPAWQVHDAQTAEVIYEESLGDVPGDGAPGPIGGVVPPTYQVLDAVALGWAHLGAAGRRRAITRILSTAPGAAIAVVATRYAVADAATGAVVASGAGRAVTTSTRRSADTVAIADFERRRPG
jgi:hypothetical protein